MMHSQTRIRTTQSNDWVVANKNVKAWCFTCLSDADSMKSANMYRSVSWFIEIYCRSPFKDINKRKQTHCVHLRLTLIWMIKRLLLWHKEKPREFSWVNKIPKIEKRCKTKNNQTTSSGLKGAIFCKLDGPYWYHPNKSPIGYCRWWFDRLYRYSFAPSILERTSSEFHPPYYPKIELCI